MLYLIARISGKLSSGHRTGKGLFSSQSQRMEMPKNVQTILHLHSFHILGRQCLKSSKTVFNSMWTEKFQMYKLDSAKAKEPEIKLPTSVGSYKKQKNSRKTPTSSSLTKAFEGVDHNKLWNILKEMGLPDHLTCLLRNLYAGQEAIRTRQ